MPPANATMVGTVASLWLYPVKSMQGVEIRSARITPRGIVGDRAWALLDKHEGHVVSAKNPRKWPNLLDLRAAYVRDPAEGEMPPVEIRLPDGRSVTSGQEHCDSLLSEYLGREVSLSSTAPGTGRLQQFWPETGHTTDEVLPAGTFFDAGTLHLVTTATLAQLQQLHPPGDFSALRFRPNIVIATPLDRTGFVENDWLGQELVLGDSVRLKVFARTVRCVMTTLPQPQLPADPAILRTAAVCNEASVGVYAQVVQGGVIEPGALGFICGARN